MAIGTASAIALGVSAISSGVQYAGARKAEKRAKSASKQAKQVSMQASQALAAREARSRVPGFGDSDNIPGYSSPTSATRNINIPRFDDVRENRLVPVSQTTFNPQGGIRNFNDFIGDQIRQTQARQRNLDNRDRSLGREIPRPLARFNEIAKRFPKSATGKPIFPDPNTSEGEKFYRSLPKSVAEIVQDPAKAQMYKGSNIVNPYANVKDLSSIVEDRSDIVTDRTGLLSDRTDLIQDRTELLEDRSDIFESAAGLAQDLSLEQEDLSDRVVDLRRGAQDFSGLASDTSVLASNAFANLQVATQAADLQAQQSDQALANTLSTIRATGAGAGGATAIAQAALQSKLNISATIEQQEARNVQARAQGQQQVEMIRMNEGRRLQDIALSERLRLEGLREREGLRIDETRLSEGRALRDLSVSEGRRLQELEVAEKLREQGISLDESLRLQQARFDTAREQDRFRFDEAGRLQEASFNEAGRLQQVQLAEALRVQEARMSEQQRLQQADAMAREYQFRVAETREQNRLNRLANQETQAVQNAATLEASATAARANRQGALVGGLTSLAGSALSVAGAGGFGKAATGAASTAVQDFSKFTGLTAADFSLSGNN
jgi:hypothetical protein|tara:strand:+ start:251 stop:2080 length:1830 start_codon:yes stop_codon:yes gene_type:complete